MKIRAEIKFRIEKEKKNSKTKSWIIEKINKMTD